MRGFFSLVIASLLLVIPPVSAAPKKIEVKALKLVATISSKDDVAGFVVSARTIVLFGTAMNKSFARAVDSKAQELWSISLDPNSSSIATAGAVDSDGNIWIAGSTSLLRSTSTPTPTPTPINPDSVENIPNSFNPALDAVALWKIPAGTTSAILYSAQQSAPVLITGIALDKNGISLVGLTQSAKGSSGFLINSNTSGEFSKPLLIGTRSTTLDAVVRHDDATLTVVGASGESLGGKKTIGTVDGVIIKISKTNTIQSVVRSSAPQAQRNWSSASSKLLLGGDIITRAKIESAVTKFSSSYTPLWTYRFSSTGPLYTLGSTYAFFLSTSVITQLSMKAPQKPQPILLAFDSKGLITKAFSSSVEVREIIGLSSSKELGIICLTFTSDSLSIFSLGESRFE